MKTSPRRPNLALPHWTLTEEDTIKADIPLWLGTLQRPDGGNSYNCEIPVAPWLLDFAVNTIAEYNIDSSHGLGHLINTAIYARIILEEYADVSIIRSLSKPQEESLIIDAAFTHDLIDHKYMTEVEGIARLTRVLEEHHYGRENIAMLITIITSMSFSVRVARRRNGLSMIPTGPLALATAIVVDADQLDGFDVERCRTYQINKHFGRDTMQHINSHLDDRGRLCRGWIKTILVNRVLKYRDEYMNTTTGKKLAAPLHIKVADYVAREHADDELFDYP